MGGKRFELNVTPEMWDVFISHAGEDKAEVALPLAEELTRYSYRVWLDKWILAPGDSLRQKIDEGLASFRLGVVILSEHFFRKPWPQAELDALFTAMLHETKPIVPVWHGVDAKTVSLKAPLMASRLAVLTSAGIEAVAEPIAKNLGARGGRLHISIDVRDMSIVGGVENLAKAIRASEDMPGSYSHRRMEVTFEHGSRREEGEIARGIRLIVTFEPLTFPIRQSWALAEAVSQFVCLYAYDKWSAQGSRIDLWRRADRLWNTGAYLGADELPRGPVNGDLINLGDLALAKKVVPHLLFEFFRREQRDGKDYSTDLDALLSLSRWTCGIG